MWSLVCVVRGLLVNKQTKTWPGNQTSTCIKRFFSLFRSHNNNDDDDVYVENKQGSMIQQFDSCLCLLLAAGV